MATMKRRGDDIQTRSSNKKPNNQERVVKFFEQLPEIPEDEWEGMHPREHFSVHYWMWIEDKNTLMQKCEYELSRSKVKRIKMHCILSVYRESSGPTILVAIRTRR